MHQDYKIEEETKQKFISQKLRIRESQISDWLSVKQKQK